MKKKCPQCGKLIKSTHTSAIYCNDSCRVNHHQKRKRKQQKQQDLQLKIDQLVIQLEKLKQESLFADIKESNIQTILNKLQKDISYLEEQLRLNDHDFFKQHLHPNFNNSDDSWVNILQFGVSIAISMDAPKLRAQKRSEFSNRRFILSNQVYKLDKELKNVREKKQELLSLTQQLDEEKIRSERKLATLLPKKKKVVKALPQKAESFAIKAPVIIGIGAEDLLKASFNTFVLPGELGRFFGQLERQMFAIGLVGDPGAGKSTFSFAIAQLLHQAGLSVIYFSLELGIGEVIRNMIAKYPANNKMRLVDKGSLDDVRQSTKQFDCIIIDSFGKLNCKSEELDRLRNDFPTTIFLFILQKTTSGSSRGGAAINYDCSMVIDVVKRDGKRIAMMKKSRYGTIGWEYDLDEEKIIKS